MRIHGLIMLAFLSVANGSLTAAVTTTATSAAPGSTTTSSAAVTVAAVSASAGSAGDWPQWHGPNRNNTSPETITWQAAGPKQLWKQAVGDGFSCVSVSKGRAYTMGNTNDQETVWCLDAKTGDVIWKYSYPCPDRVAYDRGKGEFPGPRATPTIDGNLVYTLSLSGSLLALDAAKGTLAWSADFVKDFQAHVNRWGYACSPLVEGKLLLVNPGGKGAFVVAFDKITGKVVWKSGDDVPAYASPVIFTADGQRIVAMFSFLGLYGYNLSDGKELWKTQWPKGHNVVAGDPVPLGDKLFLPYIYGTTYGLYQVTDHSIEEVYLDKFGKNNNIPPAFSGGTANVALIGGFLYGYSGPWQNPALICIDPVTGNLKWKKDKIGGPFIAAGNKLIFIRSASDKLITDTGNLVVAEASPDGYKEIGSAPALTAKYQETESAPAINVKCWTAPSLAHGLVYCRNTKGDVVCLNLRGK